MACDQHFHIPTNDRCPDCGKIIRRNELGREVEPEEQIDLGNCPNCGGKITGKWSGVECKACGWWDCI